MNLINHQQRKSSSELRKFGLVMFSALTVISLLLYFRGKAAWPWTGGVSLLFLLSALLFPKVLAKVEKLWMGFAGVLGFVMTNVLLTLVFFIGVTPTGLLMRLLGRDPLGKAFDSKSDSYWIDVSSDGPAGRPDKPY